MVNLRLEEGENLGEHTFFKDFLYDTQQSSAALNHLFIVGLENWNQICSFPYFWETATVQLFIEQGAEGNGQRF